MTKKQMIIGTRGSPLALVQARQVQALLPNSILQIISTSGDQIQDRPLADCGGKALFSKEIQAAILTKEIDIGVHSLKDMETILPEGLVLGAVLERIDARDVLITRTGGDLTSLKAGDTVGTCSPRRTAHIQKLRPDLQCVMMRGNVQTRLNKLEYGEVDALVLASAALKRLNLSIPHHVFSIDEMLPAAGQGVVAIECRAQENSTVNFLNHTPTWRCIQAERSLLHHLGGTCHTPISAYAEILDGQQVQLRARLFKDGHFFEAQGTGDDPWTVGQQTAERLVSS